MLNELSSTLWRTFSYHILMLLYTDVAPSTLFLGRQLRIHLDLVKPELSQTVRDKQASQKSIMISMLVSKSSSLASTSWSRTRLETLSAWIPAVIIQQNGPLSYLVKLDDDRVWKRHIDLIKASSAFPLSGDTPELELPGDIPELLPSSSTDTSTVPKQ